MIPHEAREALRMLTGEVEDVQDLAMGCDALTQMGYDPQAVSFAFNVNLMLLNSSVPPVLN